MKPFLLLSTLMIVSCSAPPSNTTKGNALRDPNGLALEGYVLPDSDFRAVLAVARAYLQGQDRSWALRRIIVRTPIKAEAHVASTEYPGKAYFVIERRRGSWQVVGGLILQDVIVTDLTKRSSRPLAD